MPIRRAAEEERRAFGAARLVIATERLDRSQLVSRGIVAGRADPRRRRRERMPLPRARGHGSRRCAAVRGRRRTAQGSGRADRGARRPARASGVDVHDRRCDDAGTASRRSRMRSPVARRRPGSATECGSPGVLTGPALEAAYRGADLLVAPSRVEAYGIAVADALGRGIPVLASDVGGISEAVGSEQRQRSWCRRTTRSRSARPSGAGSTIRRSAPSSPGRHAAVHRSGTPGHDTAAEVARALEEVAA